MPLNLALCQRHPRYSLLLAFVLLSTFFILSPDGALDPRSTRNAIRVASADASLPVRVAASEARYQRIVRRRKEMIHKYGPRAQDVVMFPPDREPWPAYTVWDFFPPAFNCPHEVERLGSLGDGGKWVCGLSRVQDKPDCVVYSFGLDWDSSFEADLLAETRHCEVWGYDYVAPGFGGSVSRSVRPRTHFARLGLGAADSHGKTDEPKMWTLESLMRANGHTHIDILHVDIEGWEFEVLRAMMRDFLGVRHEGLEGAEGEVERGVLPFGQLLIEFHVWHQRFADFLAFWEMLEAAGLRPFMSEVNLVYANYNRQSGVELADYSFLNIRGDNVFISDGVTRIDHEDAVAAATVAQADADEPDLRNVRHAIVQPPTDHRRAV